MLRNKKAHSTLQETGEWSVGSERDSCAWVGTAALGVMNLRCDRQNLGRPAERLRTDAGITGDNGEMQCSEGWGRGS